MAVDISSFINEVRRLLPNLGKLPYQVILVDSLMALLISLLTISTIVFFVKTCTYFLTAFISFLTSLCLYVFAFKTLQKYQEKLEDVLDEISFQGNAEEKNDNSSIRCEGVTHQALRGICEYVSSLLLGRLDYALLTLEKRASEFLEAIRILIKLEEGGASINLKELSRTIDKRERHLTLKFSLTYHLSSILFFLALYLLLISVYNVLPKVAKLMGSEILPPIDIITIFIILLTAIMLILNIPYFMKLIIYDKKASIRRYISKILGRERILEEEVYEIEREGSSELNQLLYYPLLYIFLNKLKEKTFIDEIKLFCEPCNPNPLLKMVRKKLNLKEVRVVEDGKMRTTLSTRFNNIDLTVQMYYIETINNEVGALLLEIKLIRYNRQSKKREKEQRVFMDLIAVGPKLKTKIFLNVFKEMLEIHCGCRTQLSENVETFLETLRKES